MLIANWSIMLITQKLEQIIGSAPKDLVEYLSLNIFLKSDELRINCLNLEEGAEYSECLSSFGVGLELGFWVLDDANDSNPYCYISKGPCRGAVIKYSHDSEFDIVFSSISSFVRALTHASVHCIDIDDLVGEKGVSFDCLDTLKSLSLTDTDEAVTIIDIYLNLTNELDDEIVDSLLKHDDFFVPESLSKWLLKHPESKFTNVAKKLSEHSHVQVQKLGLELLNKIGS